VSCHPGSGLLAFCFSHASSVHGRGQIEHGQSVPLASTPVLDSARPCLIFAQLVLEL